MISFCIVRDYHYYRPSWIFMCLSFSWAWNETVFLNIHCPSVKFSHQVMPNSLWPHGKQHARLPCPSPTPGACSKSCPKCQWCLPNHLILCCYLLLLPSISPSIGVFSNESVLRNKWPKYWSFSFSWMNIPMNIQDWFPLGWTGWISLQSKGLSRVFSKIDVKKHQFFSTQISL